MENKEIIQQTITKISEGIKDNAASVNQKFPVNSMRVEASNDWGELTAAVHTQFLLKDTGSAPGKLRPVGLILDWIERENITPYPRENKDGTFGKVSRESMAWAISVSQSKFGSLIYQGKKPGVDLNSVLEREIPVMLSALAKNTAVNVATAMRTALIILLFFTCSCSHRTQISKDSKKIKSEKTITVGQTFLMVGCFMLGYSVTKGYLIKE